MKISYSVAGALLFACCSSLFAGDNPKSVRAIRITKAPAIDGYLNDDAWKLADPATEFIQRDPSEGKPASEKSEVRVLYDGEALYFGCMFFDSEPEKIIARLARRDNEIESDRASIRIDSYHDHQTGYEFTFNAAGVKIDILQYDDGEKEDESWDPVWYLQTRIVPGGWSAEIKIPFRVLHYQTNETEAVEQTWGINFLRHISRKQEDDRWAFSPKSQSGFNSRFGHLDGLMNLPDSKPLDVSPFAVAKQSYEAPSTYFSRKQSFLGNGGVDIRYGVSQSFSLDATVNPDFGQVEADPAVLNLSAFETFYPEKRPFFIEGTQILHFTTFGGDFGPGMFYSRRIGRAISSDEVDASVNPKVIELPQNTTILGAAKLTGKTNGGLSIGVLQALTEEVFATLDTSGIHFKQVLEPLAHYNVVRIKQDVLDGSNIGAMFTSTEKDHRAPAFTNGYDWALRFDNNTYFFNGFFAWSRAETFSGNRGTGSAGRWTFSKTGGEHWLWNISGDYTSRDYNIDDVGFFFSPNDIGFSSGLTYKEDRPAEVVRNYRLNASTHHRWDFEGANLFRGVSLASSLLFANYWQLSVNTGADFGLYDHRETRGNGLYSKPANRYFRLEVETDSRHDVVVTFAQSFGGERSRGSVSSQLQLEVKPASWIQFEAQTQFSKTPKLEAWVKNKDTLGTTWSIFADRSTDQFNFTLRSTVTFTPELTLQYYSQIFFAKGHFENFRRLMGTSDFVPSTYTKSDFNDQSLNTNLVLRWEYFPGSTLFFVWSHARVSEGSSLNYFASFNDDLSEAFRLPPSNVLLVKVSYRWSL